MLNDFYLLNKIKEGNLEAFENVFRSYYPALMIYSATITGRKDVAEEIVQELFYKIWKNRETIQVFRSLKSYLYGAIRNQSLQYCEHRMIQENYRLKIFAGTQEGEMHTPEEEMIFNEFQGLVERVLEKLPQRRKKIFVMHRFEGKKYKEIAEDMVLSVKTIEAEMTKAYRALRKEIEKYNDIIYGNG